MKEFNLDEYLKNPSQKVVTRDGREVRIICTDVKSQMNKPFIALIKEDEDEENAFNFKENGRWHLPENEESLKDLFFAPTKKEGWVNIYSEQEYRHPGENIFSTKDEAIKYKDINYIATVKIEWEE